VSASLPWRVRVDGGVPETAPCLDGHFPGQPIVPGAILIGHAARIVGEAGFELSHVSRLKFMQPLRPGRSFTISITPKSGYSEISWSDNDAVFARARVELRLND
jgi:3-hydroxymyristoyl/3-hydroxydecanoyl-(acyl carrier protein) dehydratase